LKAAVFHGPGKFNVETLDDPTPGDGQVVVRVHYCGICGSDLHVAESDIFPVPPEGVILGHELAGEVVEVGPGVDRGRVGQNVAVVPYNYCGACEYCTSGRISICQNATDVIGLGAQAGGFAEYMIASDRQAVVLDGLPAKAGAIAEPLAVAHHGVDISGIRPGKTALVVGAGPIGALVLQVLKANGIETIICSEPSAYRRGLAATLGAGVTIDPTAQSLGDEVRKVTGRLGADFVFECSGLAEPFNQALDALKPAGTLVELGVGMAPIPIVPVMLVVREHAIKGALGYSDYFESSLRLLQSGKIDVDLVVSAERPLEQVGESFDQLAHGADLCKVLIQPGPLGAERVGR
jgi:(R,R)-butanediol dehydrogenase/meso-butanediol dehydrogenase/diacetyl reductase